MTRFEDMVAVVVGAADNMGRATARMLAAGGAKVAATYHSNAAGGAETERLIREAGGEVMVARLDHSDEAEVAAFVAAVVARFGKINILVNVAAMIAPGFLAHDRDVIHMDGDHWDEAMRFNLKGPMLMCKHILPHMIAAGYGSIVNTGSGVVFRGDTVRNAYSASKIGLHSLTMDIATSYGKSNVRCNLISPGLVMTRSVREGVSPESVVLLTRENLVPFVGEPDDIAHVACFLASAESRYITGQIIAVDGGLHVHQCVVGQV